jgi:glutamyl-tRNA reductase
VVGFSVIPQLPADAGKLRGSLVWRTCVREVALVEQRASIPPGVHALHDEAAYAHLLEVICGLESPMVGETEVMHQFKLFAAAVPDDQATFKELCQLLLADARQVRAGHLLDLGSRSYGSIVRRLVRDCRRVAIAGTGMLAKEIIPFVAGTHLVDVWGRRAAFDCVSPVSYRRISDTLTANEPTALVIAAPVDAATIRGLAARYADVQVLIDLRAEGAQDPPPPVAPIVSLADVFSSVADTTRGVEARVAKAREDISRRARLFATRAKLNPSGWHDLCA